MYESEEQKTIEEIVKWVQEKIRPARWKPKDYRRLFGQRSVEEIIRSGQTSYMNSCPDLTAATIVLLKEAGFKPTLVVQELIGHYTNKPTFHFAIEAYRSRKLFTIEYKTKRVALIYKGKYDLRKSDPKGVTFPISRIKTDKFNRKTSLLQAIGIKSLWTIGTKSKHVTYSNIKSVFWALKKHDSPRLYKFVARIQPKIIRL